MMLCLLGVLCASASGGPPVSDLKAVARDGQVFLTWKEAETPEGTTFNIYASSRPIAALESAERIAHHVERRSARDWWEDPASFHKDKPPAAPVGFLIEAGGRRLDPSGGLFVDTVESDSVGEGYYAVTCTSPDGREDTTLVAGANSLAEPVLRKRGDMAPIWQKGTLPPPPEAGKALWLVLHGKSGVVEDMEYLAFGDGAMGWRKGLPFKFSVRAEGDQVVIRPTDRVWINRPHTEAGDGGTPAIWTFWYGYNSRIYDRQLMGEGVPTNYTEHRNAWILKWVQKHWRTDPDACTISGSSMGGCGSISFGLRHPEIFAASHAHVPIVSYTNPPGGSAHRLAPSCWNGPLTDDVMCSDGVPLLRRMDGVRLVREAGGDLPFVFIIHGRNDRSIPWENNPPFYRALNDARQGCMIYWNDGEHATTGEKLPEDVAAWIERARRFRLDESYPAFSNTSTNCDPGNGDPEDGDIIGWINRGMDWREIEDREDAYAITISAAYPGIEYPVRTDVTLRRVQRFVVRPGEVVHVCVGGGSPKAIVVGDDGRITISGVEMPSAEGVRVMVRRE